jgi:hypothetical protein
MTQASEYRLEQQYNLVFACACIHNINIMHQGCSDQFFEETTDVLSSNGTSDDPPPVLIYSSEQEREEIENWCDSIAERL